MNDVAFDVVRSKIRDLLIRMKVNLEKGYNGFMRYHDITKDVC